MASPINQQEDKNESHVHTTKPHMQPYSVES